MTTMHAIEQVKAAGVVAAALHLLRGSQALAVIRDERFVDIARRERLLDDAFGIERRAKTSERLREGRLPAEGLALIAAVDGDVAGTVRLWHVRAGGCDALLLGPLAVSDAYRSLGLGTALMHAAIGRARDAGHKAILLVGDATYYARFGFSPDRTRRLDLPGPVARERFLALELAAGALANARGPVAATGAFDGEIPALDLAA